MTEQLTIRSMVDKVLPQAGEDDPDKDPTELEERLARLAALKAPTHHPESDAEPAGKEYPQPYPSLIGVKYSIGLEIPSLEQNAASAGEEASSVVRSSSPASETSHSKTADDSRNSGTSYMTTVGSTSTSGTSTSEGPDIRELEKGVFVAPRLPISRDDVEKWSSIKHRLEDALLNLFKPKPGLDPSLSWELVMAGPFQTPLKPSIVLTCCNEPHRKQLKKLLKSQKWLASTRYPVIVIIDPVHQLSLVKRRSEPTTASHQSTALGVGLGVGLGLGVLSLVATFLCVLYRRRLLLRKVGVNARATDENGNRILSWIRGQESVDSSRTGKGSVATTTDSTDVEAGYPPRTRERQQGSPVSCVDAGSAPPSSPAANLRGSITRLSVPTYKPLFIYVQADLPEKDTLCGTPALVCNSRTQHAYFTIGGTILINGSAYGLATGHSFEYWSWEDHSSEEEPRYTGEPDSEPESDPDSDSESASPWVFMDKESGDESNTLDAPFPTRQLRDDVDYLSPSISKMELQTPQPPSNELLSKGRLIGTAKAPTVVVSDYGPDNAKLDWAIIELNNTRRWTVNRLVLHDSFGPEEITEVAETAGLEDGEVNIVSGFTGVVKGWLRQTPVMLRLGCRTYEAYQIIMENPLARGDSGAWVVRDGMFCGHVIAQKTLSPIAYMLPAEDILQDIKRCMGTSSVNLPN